MLSLTPEQVRRMRSASQLFDRPAATAPDELVRHLCGVQAQDLRAAELALRARTTSLTKTEVDQARDNDRSIIRTWLMRGTLHLVAADDLGWLVPLVCPPRLPGVRRRLGELGVGGDEVDRVPTLVEGILGNEGPLTRPELAERLARKGLVTQGQAVPNMLACAAMHGNVCMGPDRDGAPTYVRARDWGGTPERLDREQALARLARRYLGAYGPAEPADLAAWSGLTLTDARHAWRAIADDLREVDVAGAALWTLGDRDPDRAPRNVVRLVPAFDTYLMGYRHRRAAVPPEHARTVQPGGGILRPTLIVDGRAVAIWKRQKQTAKTAGASDAGKVDLRVEPFESLDGPVDKALQADAADIGRFLGTKAELAIS